MSAELERIAWEWAKRCFGAQVKDTRVRALRIAEEAIELAQTLEVDKEQLHSLIDIVYARPVERDRCREMGGVMMTMAVLAHQIGVSLDSLLFDEVRRVLAKPREHFSERNQEKNNLGLN